MQFAKDTFLIALQQRLAEINPQRTTTLGAATMPAVVATENQPHTATALLPEVFYLSWGTAGIAAGGENAVCPLMKMEAQISYSACGSDAGADRGQRLGALDTELLRMCAPASITKCEYGKTPAVILSTSVFWGEPKLDTIVDKNGLISRNAQVEVFFFPEVRL